MKKGLLLLIMVAGLLSCKKEKTIYDAIIPKPLHIKEFRGNFVLDDQIVICKNASMDSAGTIAAYLSAEMKSLLNWNVQVAASAEGKKYIGFGKLHTINELGKEGYALTVNSDSIMIYANEPNGLFYGVQTLLQSIMPYTKQLVETKLLEMPCVEITDHPRFAWREMHLDVSRHFFDKEFVKKYIDVLAFHKLNVFHWHLCDNQGWRIEIKKYPQLTDVAAWRKDSTLDMEACKDPKDKCYGGYYTQDDIREVVKYAQDRFITVLPEIEMPGHSWFALYAFQELNCDGKPWRMPDSVSFQQTGPYCVGNEKTFEVLENIISEVIDLFPSPYIHIGGDECNKEPWKKCPKCQKRMKDEGFTHVDQLQSYLITRMEKFINSKGRQIFGWDEILEGGLAPDAAVMSWRGEKGGIEAAKQKHQVVMTPGEFLYFGEEQPRLSSDTRIKRGFLTLETTYGYNPVPQELSAEEKKFVIGTGGCIWTEGTFNNTEAMQTLLPQISALSEMAWIPEENKNYNDYISRLLLQYGRYDQKNWEYNIHFPVGYTNEIFCGDSTSIAITSEMPWLDIRYTTDGSEPTISSTLYTGPVVIKENCTLKSKCFLPGGKSSITRSGEIRKVSLMKAAEAADVKPGLALKIYSGKIDSLSQFASLKQINEGVANVIAIPDSMKGDFFALEFSGYIKIEKDGVYTLSTISDDGSCLFIDDEVTVDQDGVHGSIEKYRHLALAAGLHKIRVQYFEARFGQDLKVLIESKEMKQQEIPAALLYH